MAGERIRVQTLEGRWEWLGVDRYAGIHPEGLTYGYNGSGPDGCSFNLQRDPSIDHPDLQEFTPVDVVVGEQVVWDGFLIDTPAAEGLAVQALGWQYHLDDDLFERVYVHTNLADYTDMRSTPGATLAQNSLMAAGQVSNDQGHIVLSFPNGTVVSLGSQVGVILDLGPSAKAKRVVLEYDVWGNSADTFVLVRGASTPLAKEFADLLLTAHVAGSSTFAGTFTTPFRYLQLINYYSGAGGTFGADVWIRFKSVKVFTNTSYEAGNASILNADDVIKDALPFAPLLSQDTSRIASTSLAIPDYGWKGELRTPREAMEGVNVFHRYRLRLRPGRVLEYVAQANRPLLHADTDRPGVNFQDASSNSGREVYNKVIVRGRTGSGQPVSIIRYASQATTDFRDLTSTHDTNPSFATDTANWTTTALSGISRTTTAGQFDTAPAGGLFSRGAAAAVEADAVIHTLVGTWVPGALYRLKVAVNELDGAWAALNFRFGTDDDFAEYTVDFVLGAFFNYEIDWVPRKAYTSGVTLRITVRAPPTAGTPVNSRYGIDSVTIKRAVPTVVSRRGFLRTKTLDVGFPLDETTAAALGDVWLSIYGRAPLKGSLSVTSDQGIIVLVGGRPVPVSELGQYIGELIVVGNLVDHDTGALGRVGIIAGVNVGGDGATVTVDNDRGSFEALQARMGIHQAT